MSNLKIVSFEVVKAIKEAGYPLLKADWCYGASDGCLYNFVDDGDYVIAAPYALEVWLWLWEKGICIEIKNNRYYTLAKVNNKRFRANTPEEVIIAAIEYLIENKVLSSYVEM